MRHVFIVYKVTFEPTGESYVGTYTRADDIPSHGTGRPPGLKLWAKQREWARRFSAPFRWEHCRWERVDCVEHKDDAGRIRQEARERDKATNPASLHRKAKHAGGTLRPYFGGKFHDIVAAVGPEPATIGVVASRTEEPRSAVTTVLSLAVSMGYLKRDGRGRYYRPGDEKAA